MNEPRFVGPRDQPDRYQLTELRGRGGEGELWVGWVTVGDQQLPTAVKIIRPTNGVTSEALAQGLQREAELLRSLRHPGIVGMRETFVGAEPHEFGAPDPSTTAFYLVMNWAPGVNLEAWVVANPQRDPLQTTRIISRLSAAVDDMHSGRTTGGTPMLHRDIKPANVLVEGDEVTLVDFGLSRLATGYAATLVGSASYVAPEILAGSPPSAASDRYGVGSVAYFLFCGVPPDFTNPPGMRAKLMGVQGIVDSDGFTDHVMSMLDPDPMRRPSNLTEWSQGLAIGAISQRFSAPPTTVMPTVGSHTWAPPPDQAVPIAHLSEPIVSAGSKPAARKTLLIATGVALLALAIGGAAFLLSNRGDDTDEAAGTVQVVPSTSTSTSTTSTTTSTTSTSTSTSTTSTTSTTTVPVSDPGEVVSPSGPQYLADFQPVDLDSGFDSGLFAVSGVDYSRSLAFSIDYYDETSYVEYNLGRKYTKLNGTLGLSDEVNSDTKILVQIYGDGTEILKREMVLGDAVPLDMDITNILRLRFQATEIVNGERQPIVIGDARVTA